ncbi:MAG: alkaline phosphatase [Parvularculaceae bacterium]|nr:alkaline phosphatase [Parvularculaceae bacterium]
MRAAVVSLVALASLGAARADPVPQSGDVWYQDAGKALVARKAVKPNTKSARNVILFVGDGMDPTTVTAARILDGQSRGQSGEENLLAFEKLPFLAMAKTYNTNAQVPDSAGTMSAMMTGVKTKAGVLSITDAASHGDCAGSLAAKAATIGELAEQAGLATGVVTTTRLTHATPAAVYAHAPNRDWEADSSLPEGAAQLGCTDIARQLIEFPYGDGLEVALGGGRAQFTPAELADPEYPDRKGVRRDNRDLTAEWTKKSNRHRYVWNKAEFEAIDPAQAPRLLGLFETSHMQWEADRGVDPAGEPSLAEMTAKAIDILRQDKDGFFLMVEAGRIDHAHHAGNAARALYDTQALSKAVEAALSKTSAKDTLIIVTADHGHTLSIQGYPARGSNILGLATAIEGAEGGASENGYWLALDKKPYTTLGYANGPGSVFAGEGPATGKKPIGRPAPRQEEAVDVSYRQQSTVPMYSETHGGQDVTIYAVGPRAHLFGGVVEQNYIYHVISDALGLEKRAAKAMTSTRD